MVLSNYGLMKDWTMAHSCLPTGVVAQKGGGL